MTKLVMFFLVALSVSCCASRLSPENAATKLESFKQQVFRVWNCSANPENENCVSGTAFLIGKRTFVTNRHVCTLYDPMFPRVFLESSDQKVKVPVFEYMISYDAVTDLCAFRSQIELPASPFRLSVRVVHPKDLEKQHIYVSGFPKRVFKTERVTKMGPDSNNYIMALQRFEKQFIFLPVAAPGASGSPIFDLDGNIYGVTVAIDRVEPKSYAVSGIDVKRFIDSLVAMWGNDL